MIKIELLDCTLRDGGLALEDCMIYNTNIKTFANDERALISNLLIESNMDYIELGSIELSNTDKKDYAIYQSIEDISRIIPKNQGFKGKFTALFRGPDTPLDDIPQYHPGLCECVRLIVRYSELKKSIDFCAALSKKGYKVFIQPMVTLRYTESEIDYMLSSANEMNAYAVYFVDSYGYMDEFDVYKLFDKYNSKLCEHVKIGFHSHNNMNLAFSNVVSFIKNSSNRQIIVDACLLGMGQGAGNLQMEIITDYLNKNYGGKYNYEAVLDACEIIETFTPSPLWGYSLKCLLPAINKSAYKFAIDFRENHNLSYSTIHRLLSSIPEDMRHRYTPEYAKEIRSMLNL